MVFMEPREWESGERHTGIAWAPIFNQETANIQFLYDNFTGVRGKYVDAGDVALTVAWNRVASLSIVSRHEAVLLTVVGMFTAGAEMRWRLGSRTEKFLEVDTDRDYAIAKQVIIGNLTAGTISVAVDASMYVGRGWARDLQVDLREVT